MAIARPSVVDLATAIEKVPGVDALNITVTEIDIETLGMDITIEGGPLDYSAIREAIERTGAVVHSIDELAAGTRIIDRVPRAR